MLISPDTITLQACTCVFWGVSNLNKMNKRRDIWSHSIQIVYANQYRNGVIIWQTRAKNTIM